MSNQPWISIIVPAYNAEQSIKQMISSVLKQTFERFELIIVDDGSIDATKPMVQEEMREIYQRMT